MVLRPSRWRKLRYGEHRYIRSDGKASIYKQPSKKAYKKWKSNKEYDLKLRVFRFRAENYRVIMTVYIYETHDRTGRSLELDVVGVMVVSKDQGDKIENPVDYFRTVMANQLNNKHYGGLATAVSRITDEDFKSGLQITSTSEPPSKFIFTRFLINRKDYLEKVNSGASNVQKKHEDDGKE